LQHVGLLGRYGTPFT